MANAFNSGLATSPQHSDPSISTLLDVLADDRRRRILHCLNDSADKSATVGELIDWILTAESSTADVEQVATELHHTQLPRLADCGLIDHEPGASVVRYQPHPDLEALLEEIRTLNVG